MQRFIAAAILAVFVAIPATEARPRDPVGQFLAGVGKVFDGPAPRAKRLGKKRHVSAPKRAPTVAKQITPGVPEITVRPLAKDRDLPRTAPVDSVQVGMASWYGPGFHGRTTACGAITDAAGNKFTSLFNEYRMSAAHRTLKCGTQVEVSRPGFPPIVVTITDRGPYSGGRIIDLSRKAATDLGMMQAGVARVTVRVLGKE